MYTFYKPSNNPAGLSGSVGGSISSTQLNGQLGELFAHVEGPPEGVSGVYQYRKVFVKNEYASISTYTKAWFDQADHIDQISMALELSGSETVSSPLVSPTGIGVWSTPTNYVDGLSLDTLSISQSTGLWIRQYLTGISEEDPFATCRLYVGGIIG